MNKNIEKPTFKDIVLLNIQQLTNFPYIEKDFDALTDYGLLCKVVEKMNEVITNNNIQNQSINALYDAFLTLKDYIDNYFENLNIQEEVDNKLDEMVEDGTLTTLIAPYLDSLTEAAQQATSAANNAATAANNATTVALQSTPKVDILRKDLSREYSYFTLPETMNEWFNNIKILKAIDKNNYNYILDLDSFKNTGGSTIYVDCNNSVTGEGTEANPYKSLLTAVTNANDGDTIMVAKGLYYRQQLPATDNHLLWKNINIICEEGTLFTTGNSLSWTTNETYGNVYQASRTNVQTVVDLRMWDEKRILPHLQKVTTLQECANNIYTWYTDNSIIYVNLGEPVNDSNILCSLKLGYQAFNFIADTIQRDLHIYMENATFVNGYDGIIRVRGTETYSMEFIAKNCKFLYGPRTSIDGIEFLGSKSILVGCEASFNGKDGFNYHAYENTKCYGIEVDCIGQANGLGDNNSHSYNGSTVHEGCQILRINGNYFDNNGGNITDIDSDTISLNFNCNCFDSQAGTEDEFSTDFCCKYGTAKMYLYNCFSQGKSWKNIYAGTVNAVINVDHCKYDTTGGNGIINIT